MELIDRIKSIASAKGISIKNLEDAAGLGRGTIYKWETSSPRLDKLLQVADVLGVSIDEILGIKKEPAESELDDQIVMLLKDLPEDKLQRVRDFLAGISGS